MEIKDVQLTKRDYWVSVRLDEPEQEEMDYRVPVFSYEEYVVISWENAFPGPYPTDILPVLFNEENSQNWADDHGHLTFLAQGLAANQTYQVTINTNRA